MKSITLTNNTAQDIALDIKITEDRAIRDTLPAAGSLALGSRASQEELERDADFAALLAAGTVEMALADSENAFPMEVIRVNLPQGTSTVADDTNVFSTSTAPYDFRLLDAMLVVDTAAAGDTVSLEDTAAAAGAAYTTDISTAATGKILDASTTTALITRGSTVLAHRTDGDAICELILTIQRLG